MTADATAPLPAGPSDQKQPELEVEESSVWDTEGNVINTAIHQLLFDPRASTMEAGSDDGEGETVRSLEELAAAPDDRVGVIDLQFKAIRAEGAEAVAQALKRQRKVWKIKLRGASIPSEGAKALADALKVNRSLKEIDLGANNIGDRGAEALADALKVNRSLQKIDLDDNNIGDRGAEALRKVHAEKKAHGTDLLIAGI